MIADDLRNKIESGELAPGDKLPSERELAEQYGTARNIAREAVRLLTEAGLVIAEHGRGSFVRPITPLIRLGNDPYSPKLFAKALVVALDAAWRNKRRALARALANSAAGDDARIQQELLFIRAVDDIYEMDVRLLGCLADGSRVTVTDLVRIDSGLADGLLPLLWNLQSHGLIDSRSPVTPGGAMTPEPYYFITDSGRDFFARLADDAELTTSLDR